MTEAEILAEIGSRGDRVWSLLQFWTSVSFGVLIAAHFTANRLSWPVLSAVLAIYIMFTWSCARMVLFDSGVILVATEQLQSMADSGNSLGLLAQYVISEAPAKRRSLFADVSTQGMVVGLFLISLIYPVYCKLRPKD